MTTQTSPGVWDKGRGLRYFQWNLKRAQRGGRHDLSVYPQCLLQNFDAMAWSQTEKFPKTCPAWGRRVPCKLGPWGSVPPLTGRKSVVRGTSKPLHSALRGREHVRPHLWGLCVSHRWVSSSRPTDLKWKPLVTPPTTHTHAIASEKCLVTWNEMKVIHERCIFERWTLVGGTTERV